MKFKHLLLAIFLWPCLALQGVTLWEATTGYFKGSNEQDRNMRVLILHDVSEATLEVKGEYALYDPLTGKHNTTRFSGKSRQIHGYRDGIQWGEYFPELYQIQIQPRNKETAILINGQEYPGSLLIYANREKTISVIDYLSIETYTASILAEYQDKNIEPEALHALAIVARTNAYFQLLNPRNMNWDVDAERSGFKGLVAVSSGVNHAVNITAKMIVSSTGFYEGVSTPFPAEFDGMRLGQTFRDPVLSKITLDEANEMAKRGDHAAQILAKAYPGTGVMMIDYKRNGSSVR